MQNHLYMRAKEVNVDECYKCGGYFLDSGELTDIRDNYMSDSEIHEYTEKLVIEIPEYISAKKNLEQLKKRTDAIQRTTKILTINYWRKKFNP